MNKVPIGVSVLSLVPWSLGVGGMFWTHQFARDNHFCLQLVPLTGWRPEYLMIFPPEEILAYEGIWDIDDARRPTVLEICYRAVTKRDVGYIGSIFFMREPSLFIDACKNEFPDAQGIDLDGGCSEVSPVRGWHESEYLEHNNLVLDLWHVREERRGYGRVTMHPISFISDLFRADAVRLIQFQTRAYAELQGFLRAEKNNFLTASLEIMKKYSRWVPIIIELPPYFLWPSPEKKLCHIRERIMYILSS